VTADGCLRLEFGVGGGRTEITRQYQRAPLQTQSPVYPDPEHPGMAWVYMLTIGGGILQGDRLETEIVVRECGQARVTTPAATLLYRAPLHTAHHQVRIQAAAGSYLEYVPEPVIPFRGSRFQEDVSLGLDPEATVAIGNVLAPGRTAMGECHVYDSYVSRLTARDLEGTLRFHDTTWLDPVMSARDRPGLFGGFNVLGSLYCVTKKVPAPKLAEEMRTIFLDYREVRAGASELPSRSGVSVRILGLELEQVHACLQSAVLLFRTLALRAACRIECEVLNPEVVASC
jgi:urease accessory protein